MNSLFHAKSEMGGEFIFGYSDIIYSRDVLERLLKDQSDIVLVVDTDWERHYHQRFEHPISEAEMVSVIGERITRIGQNVMPREEIHGEFIRLQRAAARTTVLVTHDVREAVKLAQRLVVLEGGRVLQHAPVSEVLERPADDIVGGLLASQLDDWEDIQ